MSTTFDVFPSTAVIPTFDDVLRLSQVYLKDALAKHGVTKEFQIDVRIQKKEGHAITPFLKSSPAKWNDDEYAWFVIAGQNGGCDAYFFKLDENNMSAEDWNSWRDELLSCQKAPRFDREIRKCFDTGFCWYFRRSAGQPAIVNLTYGLIAAAFAKLTDGVIYSNDGGWDYSLFPTKANEFLGHYFDPNCQDVSNGRWAKDCWDDIKKM